MNRLDKTPVDRIYSSKWINMVNERKKRKKEEAREKEKKKEKRRDYITGHWSSGSR